MQISNAPPSFPSGDYMAEAYSEKDGKFQNGYRFYATLMNDKLL